METNYGDLDASIQEKLDADADFQANLGTLSDEEKVQAINTRKSEIFVEEVRSLKEKAEEAAKNKELADNYKIRAEKAEQEAKKSKPADGVQPPKKDSDLSSKDVLVLVKANVHEEDIDEVVGYANFKGISVSEALKSDTIKATLNVRSEQRTTAEATNVGAGRRSAVKVSDELLLSNANAGKLPESDEDIQRVVRARMGLK